jgi:hypothetical protein
VLTPAQKKVVTAGQESLKRAKDAMGKGDTDMVEFLRKGTIKSYKDAKMDDKAISELETLFNNIKPSEATENDLFTPGKEPVNGKTEEIEDVQEPDVEDPDEETDIIETNDPDEENDQVDDDDIF